MVCFHVLRSLVAFLLPHRWQGQLADATRLLAAEHPPRHALEGEVDAWLASPGWQVRNAAVKVVAHLRDEPRYPRLVEKLADRSEAGIVRRNAAEAIARVGLATPDAREALRKALADPYWEVRAAACNALARLFEPDDNLENALLAVLYAPKKQNGSGPNTHIPSARRGQTGTASPGSRQRVREDNFEVRMAIAEALGHLGVRPVAFDALLELTSDDSWPVRSQAAVALAHFAARHPGFFDRARDRLRAVDRQSDGAVSYFVHRDMLSRALMATHGTHADMEPDAFRSMYLDPKAGWNHVRR